MAKNARSRLPAAQAPVPAPIAASESSNAWLAAFLSLVFLAPALFAWTRLDWPLVFDPGGRDFNPFLVMAVAMTAAAGWQAFKATRDFARVRKYDTSIVEIDEATAGRRLRGRVRTRRDLAPTGNYLVTVRAIETVAVQAPGTVTRDSRHHNDTKLWETSRIAVAADVRSSEGIPFDIALPADVPPTTGDSALGTAPGVRWILRVEAPLAGLDYSAQFLLDVRRAPDGTARG